MTETTTRPAAEQPRFAVGDRVRVSAHHLAIPAGVEFVITRVHPWSVDDDYSRGRHYYTGAGIAQMGVWEKYLEPVAPAPTQADLSPIEVESGTPVGLVVAADGSLLNWEGENYVRQAELTRTSLDLLGLAAVVAEVKARLVRPIRPYADDNHPMVPERDFLSDAYGQELPDDLDRILSQSAPDALAQRDREQRAAGMLEAAEWLADGSEPDEAKHAIALLKTRARAIRSGDVR